MSIVRATSHLANLLRSHYESNHPEDVAIEFLRKISVISEYYEFNNLSAWEHDILGLFNDDEWNSFEDRDDFYILEAVWEVGRSNLFGSINREDSNSLYTRASGQIFSFTGDKALGLNEFDLSSWK